MQCRMSSILLSDSLFRRFQTQQCAVVFIGEHVNQTVGTLAYIADPLLQIGEQRLSAGLIPIRVENDPLEMADALYAAAEKRAHQHIVFPIREAVAGVERHA